MTQIITLLGTKLAKPGISFLYCGFTEECERCKLFHVCHENLEPGRIYKVVEVRESHHNCPVHEGGVLVVAVEESPIKILLDSRKAIEGSVISYSTMECDYSDYCDLKELCIPVGLLDGDRCRVLHIDAEVTEECKKGLKFVVAEVMRVR
ncbi:MAG: UPF0179 family protein [Candidatus Hydrothermarchaeota archaeon]